VIQNRRLKSSSIDPVDLLLEEIPSTKRMLRESSHLKQTHRNIELIQVLESRFDVRKSNIDSTYPNVYSPSCLKIEKERLGQVCRLDWGEDYTSSGRLVPNERQMIV
jgi:hypothetical protein